MNTDAQLMPQYTLRRSSRRRTIEIQVRPDSVRVLAPTRVAQSRIDRLVAEKTEWIRVRQQELRLRLPAAPASTVLEQGSQLLWLGEWLTLDIAIGRPLTRITLSPDRIRLELSRRIRKAHNEAVKEQLELWYRAQAQHYFEARVDHWSAQMKLTPAKVVVRSYRRKWGCCNSRGVVSFNWLLMMAPAEIIDYVIVHELSHLQQMNHSPAFWAVVGQYFPGYRDAKAWLNRRSGQLQWPPIAGL